MAENREKRGSIEPFNIFNSKCISQTHIHNSTIKKEVY